MVYFSPYKISNIIIKGKNGQNCYNCNFLNILSYKIYSIINFIIVEDHYPEWEKRKYGKRTNGTNFVFPMCVVKHLAFFNERSGVAPSSWGDNLCHR